MNKFYAIIVAAGQGTRFGGPTPKQYLPLLGRMVYERSIDAFLSTGRCRRIALVISPDHRDYVQNIGQNILIIDGGATRQQSVINGLKALNLGKDDIVLIHDAARPLVSPNDINHVADTAKSKGAATLAHKISDTLFSTDAGYIPRDGLWGIETPQAFRFELIKNAHDQAGSISYTDDTSLVSALGHHVEFVHSTKPNFKITTYEDFMLAEKLLSLQLEYRTGQGYDVHAFDDNALNVKSIRLCGIDLPFDRKLAGHSDADVGLHALTDAILGAICEGDIGLHFPPSDMTYKDMDSAIFLKRAVKLMQLKGGKLMNVDITLICERPKIGPHRESMQSRVAEILEISSSRVNIKATTTEKLGFTGRMEGIAAQAIATISLPVQE